MNNCMQHLPGVLQVQSTTLSDMIDLRACHVHLPHLAYTWLCWKRKTSHLAQLEMLNFLSSALITQPWPPHSVDQCCLAVLVVAHRKAA